MRCVFLFFFLFSSARRTDPPPYSLLSQSLTRRESELKEGLLRKKVLATRGRRSSNDGAPAAGDEVKEE